MEREDLINDIYIREHTGSIRIPLTILNFNEMNNTFNLGRSTRVIHFEVFLRSIFTAKMVNFRVGCFPANLICQVQVKIGNHFCIGSGVSVCQRNQTINTIAANSE